MLTACAVFTRNGGRGAGRPAFGTMLDEGVPMNEPYPGVVISEKIRKRNRWFLPFSAALAGVSSLFVIAQSVILLIHGDTVSTTRVRGVDVPTWTLGLAGIALMVIIWRAWTSDRGVNLKRDGLVNIQPMQGGLYLVGNYRSAKGVSLPVSDSSQLRIALQKTGSASYGLIKLYGLRMTSTHGDVLMDLRLMPKAFDLSPLMAELRRRRIAVDLDPDLEACHDHGAAPHVAPPSGPVPQGYRAGPPQPAQQSAHQPPPAHRGWHPQ